MTGGICLSCCDPLGLRATRTLQARPSPLQILPASVSWALPYQRNGVKWRPTGDVLCWLESFAVRASETVSSIIFAGIEAVSAWRSGDDPVLPPVWANWSSSSLFLFTNPWLSSSELPLPHLVGPGVARFASMYRGGAPNLPPASRRRGELAWHRRLDAPADRLAGHTCAVHDHG